MVDIWPPLSCQRLPGGLQRGSDVGSRWSGERHWHVGDHDDQAARGSGQAHGEQHEGGEWLVPAHQLIDPFGGPDEPDPDLNPDPDADDPPFGEGSWDEDDDIE